MNRPATYPKMALFRQRLYSSPIDDPYSTTMAGLKSTGIKEGDNRSLAIGVGSRGIDRLFEVVKAAVDFAKASGFEPFIVPAMGSHGGATAMGQKDVLRDIGITEDNTGAKIVPEIDTVTIGRLDDGTRIFFSKKALEADTILLINRIKPHTKFNAPVESGLLKMLAIGLGKADGAAEIHRSALSNGFGIIEEIGRKIIEKIKLLAGIALLEDGRGRLSRVEVLKPAGLVEAEKKLLEEAYRNMARIPVGNVDLLVVDMLGKDISGIGMDSNVTGRHRDITGDFFVHPHVKRIFVRDLSPGSGGNANGIGLADVTTKRAVEKINLEKTYANAMAAASIEKAAIPMFLENDQKALAACAAGLGRAGLHDSRTVRIKSTKHLEYILLSAAFAKEAAETDNLEQISPFEDLKFDKNGNLLDFYPGGMKP